MSAGREIEAGQKIAKAFGRRWQEQVRVADVLLDQLRSFAVTSMVQSGDTTMRDFLSEFAPVQIPQRVTS